MHWVTYFPKIANVHLTKDLGLIPLYMQRIGGYRSSLVARFPHENYPALEGEAEALHTHELTDAGNIGFLDKSFLRYLRENASKIDVLNLFQLSRDNIFYGLAYKYFNPSGKLYLKLDTYNQHLQERKAHARSRFKRKILQTAENRFFQKLDLVSVENSKGYALALDAYPQWKGKLIYLPNGCNDYYLKQHFQPPFAKENIVLSVGQPGSEVKNYDLFLHALKHLKTPANWRFRIVGPISDDFKARWEESRQKQPKWAARVEFTGQITDRLSLYEEFARAKVFFLPSHFESFGLVYTEALYFGCVLVGHKAMSAYDDLSLSGKYGTYFKSNQPESFARAIEAAIELSEVEGIEAEIRAHSEACFYYSKIAETLKSALDER